MIFHITTAELWSTSPGEPYHHPSLADEGFIHLSSEAQLAATAARYFAGRADLVVLMVDETHLGDELVWEDTTGRGERFPHLYQPLARDTVAGIVALPVGPDGVHRFPEELGLKGSSG